MEEYTNEKGFLSFFETSAKDGTNLEESIMMLVDHIMKNNIESESSRELNRGVDLNDPTARSNEGSSGCC